MIENRNGGALIGAAIFICEPGFQIASNLLLEREISSTISPVWFNFEKVLGRVAELLDLKPEQVLAVGKYKKNG